MYQGEQLVSLIKKDYHFPVTTVEETRAYAESAVLYLKGTVRRIKKTILLIGVLVVGTGIFYISLYDANGIEVVVLMLLCVLPLGVIVGVFRLLLFHVEIVVRTLANNG